MMKKMMVPANLKADKIIGRHNGKIKGFDKDKMYFICHCIYSQMSYLNEHFVYPGKEKPYYVPLSSSILKSKLGNTYRQIVDMMKQQGVVEQDGSWQNDKISQGYRFTNHYLGSTPRWVTPKYSPLVRDNDNLPNKRFEFEKRVVSYLEGWFAKGLLSIDYKAAKIALDKVKVRELENCSDSVGKLQANVNYLSRLSSVERITKCKIVSQDDFGYRVHSPITQLKSEFRCLVQYNGEELVQVDIKNSQLYFMMFLLDPNNWKMSKKTRMIWKHINREIKHKHSNTTTIMFLNSPESPYSTGLQIHPFVQDCINGRLYETVMHRVNFNQREPVDRDYVKETLMGQLFCSREEHCQYFIGNAGRVWESFKALYPQVVSVIEDIKSSDYKDICRLLQRIEATAMLKYVCRALKDTHPDVPVFTLHDCIVTTQSNVLLVEQVMLQQIGEFMGIPPRVEVTPWAEHKIKLDAFADTGNQAA